MPSTELLYQRDELLIVSALFALLLATAELGFRIGRRNHVNVSETTRSQIGALQGGVIGLLALLLAFTFAMATTRFETRMQVGVDEANAIGTSSLRAKALPQEIGTAALKLLREYVDLRIKIYDSTSRPAESQDAAAKVAPSQERLWSLAVEAAQQDPRSIPTGLFISGLNDLIDLQTKRDAATRNHVPESALILLVLVTALTVCLIGYGFGLNNARHPGALLVFAAVVCLVILVVIDLDRPRRGLIKVSQQAMTNLRDDFDWTTK